MKKFALTLCALAGLCAFGNAAKADRGDDYDADDAPRYSEPRQHREYYDHVDRFDDCRPRRVYIIERGYPVRRIVYFDRFSRCFYPVGPRRVYVQNYYTEYPRQYAPRRAYYYGNYRERPHFSAAFGF